MLANTNYFYTLSLFVLRCLLENFVQIKVSLPAQDSSTISFIYRKAQVLDCDYATDGKARFTLRIRKDDLERLKGLISSSS